MPCYQVLETISTITTHFFVLPTIGFFLFLQDNLAALRRKGSHLVWFLQAQQGCGIPNPPNRPLLLTYLPEKHRKNRSTILSHTQRVLQKFECEKKWFTVMVMQKCQNEIYQWQTWESRDWKKELYALTKESFSFILFWKQLLFHISLKIKNLTLLFWTFSFSSKACLLESCNQENVFPESGMKMH